MLLFIKEFFERVEFGKKTADIKIATNITQHAKSVSLKCVLERCETAIKTNGPLLRYRMAGITESAMVAYTHKYAVV